MKVLTVLAVIFFHNAAAASLPADWRIIGGLPAQRGSFPYQVALFEDDSFQCGGSIINQYWILTAAHCVESKSSLITVQAGSHVLGSGGRKVAVSNVVVHEKFGTNGMAYDIAVLRLSEPLEFSAGVQNISLGTTFVPERVQAVVSGWGITSLESWEGAKQLQYLNVTTVTNRECADRHYPIPVDAKELCAFRAIGNGVCYGDSGGPIVASGELIGIVSWAFPCAVGYPDVFVRVSYYIDWIQSVVY